MGALLTRDELLQQLEKFIKGDLSNSELENWAARYDFEENIAQDESHKYLIQEVIHFLNMQEIEEVKDDQLKDIFHFLLPFFKKDLSNVDQEVIFNLCVKHEDVMQVIMARLNNKVDGEQIRKLLQSMKASTRVADLDKDELYSILNELHEFKISDKFLKTI